MSVALNEVAIRRLLESEDGPVGQDLRRRAEQVVEEARNNARRIMHRSPVPVAEDVGYALLTAPLRVEVGITDSGRMTRYLANKAIREREGGWLSSALGAFEP